MPFANVNDLTLHYQTEGPADRPALVFANSLGSDFRIWDDVAARLVDDYHLIRYDKRGHGLSDCPPGPYTIADHAADLAALLAHLGVAKVTVIGVSVGGMIAQQFAARHPGRVDRLVLSDTGAQIGTAAYWAERIGKLETSGFDELGETILSRWFAPGFAATDPATYRGYGHMLTRTPLSGYIATCAAIRDADLRDAAAIITAPTLVLCGDQDVATPPALGRELAALIPNARFQLIDGAGHLPGIEQPAAVAAAIRAFLRE
jgi:3-oxoadipate enol-lactonase